MKRKRAELPITVGEITIIPLVEISIHNVQVKEGLSIYFSKEPIGIAIGSPEGKWAIDMHGEPLPLDDYIREVDGLHQALDNL